MREIRFRGKRLDNGEWVYGSLVVSSAGKTYIIPDNVVSVNFAHIEVDPKTVGQYTGLKDRSGREIYEGDVLRLVLVDYAHVPEQIFVVGSDSFFEDVCYLQNISRFVEDSGSETDGIEVIGNIYENPELPKGEESE